MNYLLPKMKVDWRKNDSQSSIKHSHVKKL
jgi:hypothetical protein